MKVKKIILLCIFVFLLPELVLGIEGPDVYLIEQVKAHFSSDGNYAGTTYPECGTNPCMYGYVQVAPPNTQDVLQYIRVNISSTSNTNLQSVTAYKGTLGSPTASPVTINVNTTDSDPDTEYNITSIDLAPPIRINLTSISNWEGGRDIYDADNIFPDGSSNPVNKLLLNFSIYNPSTTKTLSNVQVTIQFNTTGTDCVNIPEDPGQSGGTSASRENSDGDSNYDRVVWSGTLSPQETAYVWFNITTQEGVNFQEGKNSLSLDDSPTDTTAYFQNLSSTLTEKTITGKFCRGPVRQGIDLAQDPNNIWKVRGFIKNQASGSPSLVYNLTRWYIYQIDETTGEPMTPPNQSGSFQCTDSYCLLYPDNGTVKTTDYAWTGNNQWFNTSTTSKPYYTVGFDWEVVWNDTYYRGYINTSYDMPELYKIDMGNQKSIDGSISPDTGGENLTIRDETTVLGDSHAPIKVVQILSVVPVNNINGEFHGSFYIYEDSVEVGYYNSTSSTWTTLTKGVDYTLQITQPSNDGSHNGLVNVTINDTTAAPNIGGYLLTNDKINLTYKVRTNESMTLGDTYTFTGNTTTNSSSGTPLTENHPPQSISVAGKQLTGWKELIGYDVNNPNLINATILIQANISGTGTIDGIKFIDYIPNGTDIDGNLTKLKEKVTVRFFDGSTWVTWTEGVDYAISDNGTVTLPDGLVVNAYEFYNASGDGWKLSNGQKINVTYQMNVTSSGTYVLPTVISGFDPITGIEFNVRAIGSVTVELPTSTLPLEIEEGEFKQERTATVNKPVLWKKEFTVYNPNERAVTPTFKVKVFNDVTEGYVSYYDENGKKIDEPVKFVTTNGEKYIVWKGKINPFESRDYEIIVLTPSVIEVDRDVEVLEKLPNKKVKVLMNIYVKNFAKENYENVVLKLPIKYENIIDVKDSFGRPLQIIGGKFSTKIIVGKMNAGSMKAVTVIYKQPYPTIIVTPEKDEFKAGSPIGLNILIINGGEEIKYPYVEIEIYTPEMSIVKSDIKRIKSLQPLEKTELTERYFLPLSVPTGRYIATARFKKDFVTLASGTGYFFLTGSETNLTHVWGSILLIGVIVLMAYLSYKRIEFIRKNTNKSKVI